MGEEKQLNNANNSAETDVEAVIKESTESDPCMMDGDSVKKNNTTKLDKTKNFFVQFRSRTCERWGLSHKVFYTGLVLVGVLVILLIVVICLVATFPRIPHSMKFPICKDPSCLRASSQIRDAMNASAPPCTDLWALVCDGWLQRNPLPNDKSVWNQKKQLIKQDAVRVRELIATLDPPLQKFNVDYKLKHLYENCMDLTNINIEDKAPITKIITDLGGWYILRDWSQYDFDYKRLLTNIHVNYGVSPFFKITVDPDPFNSSFSTIRISPSGLGMPDKDYYYQDEKYINAYKNLIHDVAQAMEGYEASKFATDIFSFEKRIAEKTPDASTLQNPTLTSNYRLVSALENEFKNIPIYDILMKMFPNAEIKENTEVVVTSVPYLHEIDSIISATDDRTKNQYLIWCLVRDYLPYLSKKFTRSLDNYNAEIYGRREPLKRWETCVNLVNKMMSLAVRVFDEKSKPIANGTLKIVDETFQSIRYKVREHVKKFHVSMELKNHLFRKLSNLKLQMGLPKHFKENDSYLKEHYNSLKIFVTDFFMCIKHSVGFQNHLAEQRLRKGSEDNLIIESLQEYRVRYLPSHNLVVIPTSLLHSPYFESNYPASVIYGRLGVEIAEAIIESVLPYGSLWTNERKIFSAEHFTANETIKSITGQRNCLFKYILNSNLDVAYNIANETALNTFKHIAAVSVANEAMLAGLGPKHVHQPALENYEDSSLFFLAYGQTQCSNSTNQFQLYDKLVNFKLTQHSMLYIVWSQLSEFSKAFDCNFNEKVQCHNQF